jgi:ferredoxin-NADP reductase
VSLGGARFPYRAGQAVYLGQPASAGPVPYSIASAPEESRREGHLEFLIKTDDPGKPSAAVTVGRGGTLAVEGPFGSFVFPERPAEREFLFVAGGTGIAPLRSMIRHALETQSAGRLHLLYSARTPADFAYLPELRQIARAGRLQLALTATREVPAGWRGERGRITPERLAPLIEAPETLCFVCGPAAMVDAVPRMLLGLGIDRSRIRIEEW